MRRRGRTPFRVGRALGLALAVIAGSAVFVVPRGAAAQDAAAAEVLFEHGRALLTEGKIAEACPKLEESLRLDPGIGTMLYLGECWQRAGKTASAWLLFRGAEARAAKDNDPRAKIAHDRAEMLTPLVSMLAVRVANDPAVPTVTVTRDGRPLEPAQWGVEIAIDPGDHVVRASAPGRRTWESKIVVGVNASHLVVAVPPLEPSIAALGSPPVAPDPDTGDVQRGLALGVGGLGLLGVGAGSYFGLSAIAKNNRADQHCTGLECDAEGVATGDDAKDHATVSTIAFVAGTALLVGGVVLFLTAPRARSAGATPASITTSIGPRSFGFRF